jgi:hypothetical protein
MLYLKSPDDKVRLVVLEAGNLDDMRAGRSIGTPDGEVVMTYTPDPVWLADKVLDSGGDMDLIIDLITESQARPQKPADRPDHKTAVRYFRND